MDAFALLPDEEREAYFQEAAAQMGLPAHIIEKDFWVCWTLKRLFALETVCDSLIFKGGTSLSKCYGLIRRFSEDIDLSIHRASLGFTGAEDPAELGGKAFRRANEALAEAARTKIFGAIQPELEAMIRDQLGTKGWKLDKDETDPEGQSLAFAYPRTAVTLKTDAYLPPKVKIEFGARSDHEPSEVRAVTPYLAEALPGALNEPATTVKVISAVRTFWEKATILHQIAHLQEAKAFPPRYSRHYCDVAAMIEAGIGEQAESQEVLLATVVRHKMIFYRAAWASYETAKRGSLKLLPVASRISEVAKDLDSMKEMFFGPATGIDQVLGTLEHWERAFNNKTDKE
mgnify:CR=1 FL=1